MLITNHSPVTIYVEQPVRNHLELTPIQPNDSDSFDDMAVLRIYSDIGSCTLSDDNYGFHQHLKTFGSLRLKADLKVPSGYIIYKEISSHRTHLKNFKIVKS